MAIEKKFEKPWVRRKKHLSIVRKHQKGRELTIKSTIYKSCLQLPTNLSLMFRFRLCCVGLFLFHFTTFKKTSQIKKAGKMALRNGPHTRDCNRKVTKCLGFPEIRGGGEPCKMKLIVNVTFLCIQFYHIRNHFINHSVFIYSVKIKKERKEGNNSINYKYS